MSATITWAIKNGQYAHVSIFEPSVGLNCGCICPECKELLGSRIYSQESNRESCYFHKNEESTCSGGQKESELHLLAKKVFEKNTWFMNPPFKTSGKLRFNYVKIALENKTGNIRPDIVLTSETGNQLLVEIAVTSFIKGNQKKIDEIKQLRIPTIEIDVSKLHYPDQKIDDKTKKDLTHLLIDSIDVKTWIWNTPEILEYSFEERKAYDSYNWLFWILGGLGLFFWIKRNRMNSPQHKIKKHRSIKKRSRSSVSKRSAKYY